MTIAEDIKEFINKNRGTMLEDLHEAVAIHSGTFTPEGTSRMAEHFGQILSGIGFDTTLRPSEEFGTHLLATHDGQGPKIFVAGHIDTVFEGQDNWDFSQDTNHCYGPGVIDMKSGLLSFVWACKALAHSGGLNGNFQVFFNSDEEPGSPESRTFIADYAQGCDYALVLEPAEPTGEILRGRKGVGIFHFKVEGVAAHAGQEPEKGASAINAAASMIEEINKVADPAKGTTINVGIIEGGSAIYAIAPHCTLSIDARVPTVEEGKRLEEEFKAIAERFSKDRISVAVNGSFHRPPMAPSQEVLDLIAIYQAAAKTYGYSIDTAVSGAASDGNTLAGLGLPVLDGLGPVGGRAHSSEEYMETESFFERTITLALFLHNVINHN